MTLVRMIAIEPCNGKNPGEDFEVGEREAVQLEARRLARPAVPPHNRMRAPARNQANPPRAAGGARQSSASPAARASVQTTAHPSAGGGRVARKTSRTPSDGSSQ